MADRVVLSLVILLLSCTAGWGSLPWECGVDPNQELTPYVNPADTVVGVAIYAIWEARDTVYYLSDWWRAVWDTTKQYSVPRYFSDLSFGKHRVRADPYGRADSTCFVSPYPDTFDGGGKQFTRDILTRADSVIDFARYDADSDGYVDFVFLTICRTGGTSCYPLNLNDTAFVTSDTGLTDNRSASTHGGVEARVSSGIPMTMASP